MRSAVGPVSGNNGGEGRASRKVRAHCTAQHQSENSTLRPPCIARDEWSPVCAHIIPRRTSYESYILLVNICVGLHYIEEGENLCGNNLSPCYNSFSSITQSVVYTHLTIDRH